MLSTLGIALVAFFAKGLAFWQPLTGYFGSYQAVNGMIAEMMGAGTFADFFIPRTFLLVNGSPGLHLLYYPLGSLAAFLGNAALGGGIPFWGRLQAGIFVWGATLLLYRIAREFSSKRQALLAVFFFSFFPMVLLSGIVLQNEAAAIFFLVFSFWLARFQQTTIVFLSGLFFSISLIARIHFVVALPAFLLYVTRGHFSWRRIIYFSVGMLLPMAGWMGWMYHLEVKYSDIVQTSIFSQLGEGRILPFSQFTSLNFYKRIIMTLSTYWCTPILAPFACIGLFQLRLDRISLLAWAWGSLSLILLLSEKIVDHPFYLLVGAPPLAVLTALCLSEIWERWSKILRWIICFAFVITSGRFFLPPAITFSDSEKALERIGIFAQQKSSPEDLIIASHGSSIDLLFYCHRKGWPFDIDMVGYSPLSNRHNQRRYRELLEKGYGDPVRWLEFLRTQGARYLILAQPRRFEANHLFSDYVRHNYHEIITNDLQFRMFDLSKNK